VTNPAIYVRQSIDHQEGIDRALGRARQLVASRGWPEAVEFTDNAVSASRVRDASTGWGQLLRQIALGQVDTVVGIDIDRLIRSTRDLNVLIDLGVKVVTVDGEIDLTTADGEFRATMLAGIARFETRRKGERQVRGNEGRVAKGLPVAGKRRFGFEPGNLTERTDEGDTVRALFAGIAAGDSVKSWGDRLGKPPIRVREILTNPSYAGFVVRQGERFEAHSDVARVVDRGLFETVQLLLSDPARKTSPGNTVRHLASGIAECSTCGGKLVKVAQNYVCVGSKKGHPSIKVELLDEWLILAVQHGLGLWANDPGDEAREREARERIAALDEALATAQDLALLPGANMAHLRGRIVELGAEREDAVAELSRALTANLPLTELLATGDEAVPYSFDLTGNFDSAWEALTIDRQRELVRRLIKSAVVHPGRGQARIQITPRVPESFAPRSENPRFAAR
jgi:DNA invertase Pin-like site-specific DNA recombinase